MNMNSSKADVSIIMPMYNGKNFIETSFFSAMNQNFNGNIELVVIDDGSSDGSIDHALKLSKCLVSPSFNIKLYDQEHNGIACTKYNASKQASADIVLMLDQDDALSANAVDSSVKAFEMNPDAAIVYSDHFVVNKKGELTRNSRKRQYDLVDFLTGFPLGHLKGFKKDVLLRHYPDALDYRVAEDLALCSSIIFDGHKMVHIPQFNYIYFVDNHNVTQTSEGLKQQYKEAHDIIRKNFAKLGVDNVSFRENPVRLESPDAFTHYLRKDEALDLLQNNSKVHSNLPISPCPILPNP